MKGFHTNIDIATRENKDFRHVLYTGKHTQLVLMSLLPGEEIGLETHLENDQFFRFEKGVGRCIIDGNEYEIKADDAIIIPAGAAHNIMNTSKTEALKMYTLYSPPHHKDSIVRSTKAEAETHEAEFDGITTE